MRELEIDLPHDSTISFLKLEPKKVKSAPEKVICFSVLSAAKLTIET